MKTRKAGIVLEENSLYDNPDSASNKSKKEAHPNVMSVMMADITIEATMAEMEESYLPDERNQPQQQSVSVASLLVQQLQDMIANSIRAQYGGLP
ncbi:ty3-gypsy retrotransposon protein [Cucumis melo var. makuwa]|uniref:Ty3-gypsy retrotransposon protein n=1 Tax=Cucumis melo var. makuwa TaxID=1194695 RepID=A0A5D3C7C7_CUCMM|nr:ty3-gypsy retrotransposon protein [Cucumis melo var. makuwa]TYK07230.1 ty3-gypsy retrotransposon protein [Cucumis melo var. makuwa]